MHLTPRLEAVKTKTLTQEFDEQGKFLLQLTVVIPVSYS